MSQKTRANLRPDHRAAIERLAKARQDNKVVFNDPEVVGKGVTKATIASESGPAAKAEHEAAREVVQAMANEVGPESGNLIRAAAEADHASYSQYADRWVGWTAARMAGRLRVKSGAVAAGDWVLFDGEATIYSITIGGDVACNPEKDLVAVTAPTRCTLHPFGDEWLWDETGRNGLTVPLDEAAKVAEAHRAECMNGDESQREFFAGMWFSVCEATSGNLVALVSPNGKLLQGDEAMAWYGCIGTDGKWPKPTSILIEWDGGFTTASSEEEAEAIIARKLEEWEAAGDAGERGDFLVSPNLPEATA